MAKIKPLTGNMLPVVIATGGYTLQAPGMTGSVKSLSNQESATRSDSGHHAEHLLQALQGSEIDSQKILEFEVKDDAVRASGLTARAGELTAVTRDGEPAIILRAPILEEKAEQAVLYTDEAGVSRWIFPEAVEDKSVQASRGAGPEAVFHLPRRSAPLPQNVTTDENANRGPLAVLGRRMVHLLTWATDDIVGKGAVYVAEQWESRRRPYALRSFPEMESASQDSIDWGRISKGRALLFIHGTFSTASSAFAELPKSTLDSLSQLYEGRLLAFNHPSLSVSPEQNAQAFIDLLPDEVDLKLDVVTHSRGGLVGRELIERFAQLHAAGRKLKVERAVMVAAPQRGTILTDEDHGIALIDRFTNLLTKLPDNAYTLTVEGVLMLVKLLAHGALKGLPGLRSMYPGGEYLKRLNSVPLHTTRYFAVGAQFVPSLPALRERFGKYIGEKFLDEVFGEASDGVVPTLGSYDNGAASALFPISNDHRLIFDQSAGIHHCNYFGNERLNGELIKWLAA